MIDVSKSALNVVSVYVGKFVFLLFGFLSAAAKLKAFLISIINPCCRWKHE